MSVISDGSCGVGRERLRRYFADANLPSLVMALLHLTGDRRWLQDPFRPTRPSGLDPHDSGGYPPEVRRMIVDEAVSAFEAWTAGRPAAEPAPDRRLLQEMMSAATGEHVPSEYADMMSVEMGFTERPALGLAPTCEMGLPYLVVGAGISGLCVSRLLREANVPFVLVEKNHHLGGTWYENDYPGAGVDTPSYLYSFSDFPRDWSRHFAKRDEIYEYIVAYAKEHDLVELVEFGTEVVSADYCQDGSWDVRLTQGGTERQVRVRGIVTATGFLNRPRVPKIPGLNTFSGESFHSARWPTDLDVSDQHVAVVGTGASAMQIVPAIVDDVCELTIFQRSPQWAAPTPTYFEPVDGAVHWLTRNLPYYHAWYRFRLAWTFMDRLHGAWQIDDEWRGVQRAINRRNDAHRRVFTEYIREALQGHDELLPHAVPDYPPFAKRMLLDNGWYDALKRPHVTLVPDPVAEVRGDQVLADSGDSVTPDVLVLCTGFEAQRPLFPMQIRGVDGLSLREAWNDDDARAYLGMTTPGFPNLFMMYGPNTNPGGGSYILIAELQARYIARLIVAAAQSGAIAIEPRQDRFEEYNAALDEAHRSMIWSHLGVDTYYRNASGRVVTNMPWRVVDYWRMLQTVTLDAYRAVV